MTRSVTLFYQVTQDEVIAPKVSDIERKDNWIKAVQSSVEADWKPMYIKVKYEIHNPDIQRQVRFFNGTVVKYFAIQNEDILEGEPSNERLKMYREHILDEVWGYDMHLVEKTVRKRKSTTDLKSVQAWSDFLNTVKETIFDPAGYEFPNSEDFWDLVSKVGYNEAADVSIKKLQELMKRKCQSTT